MPFPAQCMGVTLLYHFFRPLTLFGRFCVTPHTFSRENSGETTNDNDEPDFNILKKFNSFALRDGNIYHDFTMIFSHTNCMEFCQSL